MSLKEEKTETQSSLHVAVHKQIRMVFGNGQLQASKWDDVGKKKTTVNVECRLENIFSGFVVEKPQVLSGNKFAAECYARKSKDFI